MRKGPFGSPFESWHRRGAISPAPLGERGEAPSNIRSPLLQKYSRVCSAEPTLRRHGPLFGAGRTEATLCPGWFGGGGSDVL